MSLSRTRTYIMAVTYVEMPVPPHRHHLKHILTIHGSEPSHRPLKEVELCVLRDPRHVRPLHLVQRRLDPHRPLLKHLPVPQLPPALGRVREEPDLGRRRAPRLASQSGHRQPTVAPEEYRAGLGRQEAREGARELRLPLFVEEVEEGRRVDRGDVPAERVERGERGEVRARVARGVVEVERGDLLEERGVEGVPRDERDRERLWGGLE